MSRTKALGHAILAGRDAHYEDAAYYDEAYKHLTEDIAFYVSLASRTRGDVLELGTGTGRVACAIADALSGRRNVVGMDRMRPMLKRAEERKTTLDVRARQRVSFIRGHVEDFALRSKFGLIVAPFNVLMHLYDWRDFARALSRIRAHLAPKGLFAFDVLMPDAESLDRDPSQFFRSPAVRHPTTKKRYRYKEAFEYDVVNQVQNITLIFEGKGDDSFVTPLSQRQYFPQELDALLHMNGFRVQQHSGGFDGRRLTRASESQVVVATAGPLWRP